MKQKNWLLVAAFVSVGLVCSHAPAWASGASDGEYVEYSVWGDSSEAINDEQINASASESGDSGEVSITARDDFYAGDGYDTIYRQAGAYAYFGKSYRWESNNGDAPAPYSYTTTINYNGTANLDGDNYNVLDGWWGSDYAGGSIRTGDSSNVSRTETYESERGYSYISVGLGLNVFARLEMWASRSSVSGSLSQSLDGSVSEPSY